MYPARSRRNIEISKFKENPYSGIICGRILSNSEGEIDIYDESDSFSFSYSNGNFNSGDIIEVEIDEEIIISVKRLAPGAIGDIDLEKYEHDRVKDMSDFIKDIRRFFDSDSFTEVHTPLMVEEIGFESNLVPFMINEIDFKKNKSTKYLITSPELECKKLLSLGFEKIYNLSSVFRNAEVKSNIHKSEFKMIEWYRAYASYLDIIKDIDNLFYNFGLGGVEIMTVRDAFLEYADMNIDELYKHPTEELEDEFYKSFLVNIEPKLGFDGKAIALIDWPECMASLSKIRVDGEIKVAERFEIYCKGIELANGFSELNDPDEQEERIDLELEKRKNLGLDELPKPEEFLVALRRGIPPSGGVAMGIDRLFMLIRNEGSIL
jgi:lysyl-tRNA synthetase class 2